MGEKRGWFGPSQKEVWAALAPQVGGVFEPGRWTKPHKIMARHGAWTFTLDTFVVPAGKTYIPFTRLRAPYVNPDGFRFKIRRRSVWTSVAEALGLHDVQVGHEAFDEAFVIHGSDPDRLRALFDDEALRAILEVIPEISLEVKDDEGWFGVDFPEGVDELCLAVAGVIKDEETLKHWFELFAALLDRLCAIGSAYRNDPGVAL
jgi:hypothetical protein